MFGDKKLKAEIKSLKSDIDRARQDTFIVITEQQKLHLDFEKSKKKLEETISHYEKILSDCYVRDSKGRFMKYRKEYKVTEKDLIGQLKGFPIEVVHKMVDYQVEQGNEADVTVFQKDITSGEYRMGFTWNKTKELFVFWHNVIEFRHFDTFFEKYPKNNK